MIGPVGSTPAAQFHTSAAIPAGLASLGQPRSKTCFARAAEIATLPIRPEGLEPPTLGSEDRCSIQLSYGRVDVIVAVERAAGDRPV